MYDDNFDLGMDLAMDFISCLLDNVEEKTKDTKQESKKEKTVKTEHNDINDIDDIDEKELDLASSAIKKLFDSYVRNGFTEDQAMRLVYCFIKATM